MGRRGPKPAPNVLKLLRGNPGKRPINQEEPISRLEIPNPPWELEPDVKKEWDKLCEELYRMRILGVIDAHALASYCENFVQWWRALKEVKKKGMVGIDPKGFIRINPYLKITDSFFEKMKNFWEQFGMTPSARSKLRAQPNDSSSDEEDDLFGT
jgi:P27 family predicted phage terminase small subunit